VFTFLLFKEKERKSNKTKRVDFIVPIDPIDPIDLVLFGSKRSIKVNNPKNFQQESFSSNPTLSNTKRFILGNNLGKTKSIQNQIFLPILSKHLQNSPIFDVSAGGINA
jgi:hypothetical protein